MWSSIQFIRDGRLRMVRNRLMMLASLREDGCQAYLFPHFGKTQQQGFGKF